MEIYTGKSNKVTYYGEPGWSVSATWTKNGVDQGTLPVTTLLDEYTVVLPYILDESEISINWEFNIPGAGILTKTQNLKVETPLLSPREVRKILDENDLSDEDAREVERSVRLVIQAHTGQTFGRYVGKIRVPGSDSEVLRFPRKLISLSAVDGHTTLVNDLSLNAGGWALRARGTYGVPPVKADWQGFNERSVPITSPLYKSRVLFRANQTYEIDGVWGWEDVPAAVSEAARLLIEDYSCSEGVYRDRFLKSMSAADWRMEFNQGAYEQTGNIRADQLLSNFIVHRDWVVL